MLNGIDEWLTNLEIAQMILVRVVLADVRAQAPQMLQAENAGGDGSDNNDKEDPKEDLERKTKRTKIQRRV